MKKINLKEVVIQKELSENNYNYNEDKKSDYNIYISKKEFNNIIFLLNTIITDINNNQKKSYLTSQIEKIIFKLKNFDIPPEIQLNTIPTFKTEKLFESNEFNSNQEIQEKEPNYNKMEFDLKELGIDTKTYCSNFVPENTNKNTKYINNNQYEGQIINGKKEGKGKFIYKNGCIYEGYFKNDKKEGNGIFYYANGDRYKGLFKNGFYQGNGIFYFNNGDRYEGEFDKNSYSGNGKYYYHNGDKFEGVWKNDKKNGKGAYIYLNGNKIIGNYKDGKPIGTHIKYSNEGKLTSIKYSDEK